MLPSERQANEDQKYYIISSSCKEILWQNQKQVPLPFFSLSLKSTLERVVHWEHSPAWCLTTRSENITETAESKKRETAKDRREGQR